MEKRGVIVAIVLILSSIAMAAENYNKYTSLEINVNTHTTIELNKKSGSATVESLEADLELFPRTTPEQQVIKQEVKAEPEADIEQGERDITIKWGQIKVGTVNYTVSTDVKTYNRVRQIQTKIDFPIQDLDPEMEIYTEPTEYIDVNEDIRKKAAEIAEGETDLYITTYKMGEWVRKNVKYDLNTLTINAVQRSSWVLANKEGVCDEITNLFISMERSLGIPARFVSGVVYSNIAGTFENHGWAEIYMPEYGWVPFDVTFGQYGWIDATHVKMDESRDSGEAAVTYTWRAKNIDLIAKNLEIETMVNKKEGTAAKLAKFEIRPIEQDVGFGSYMVLEITAENMQDYYLPISFTITKAPEIVGEKHGIHAVLEPEEKKKFYWTLKIPGNLDENYIYTTDIEVEGDFAGVGKTTMRYGHGFKEYTEEWAKQTYNILTGRESKILFTNIYLKCKTDKVKYLSTENAKIKCVVKNVGNKNLDMVKVCTEDKCKETALSIAEEREIPFEIELKKSKNLTITAETEKYVREETIILDVREIPEIRILSYEPDIIDYQEKSTLVLNLFTKTKATDVELTIQNIGDVEIKELEGIYPVRVPITGKQLRKGWADIKIIYKSEQGEIFAKTQRLEITVKKIPWYARLLNWLGL